MNEKYQKDVLARDINKKSLVKHNTGPVNVKNLGVLVQPSKPQKETPQSFIKVLPDEISPVEEINNKNESNIALK
jgi:hypothetical protein